MELKETGLEGVYWIRVAEKRVWSGDGLLLTRRSSWDCIWNFCVQDIS